MRLDVTVCVVYSRKNGSLNGHSRPNQSPNLFTREGVRRIATNTVVGLQPGVFVRIFQETLRPSYRLGKDMRDRKDNRLCFHDKSAVLSARVVWSQFPTSTSAAGLLSSTPFSFT